MLFVSPIFLFFFLPIVMISYYLLKKRRAFQNYILFFVSVVFYAWGEPKYVILMLFSISINWGLAYLIEKFSNKKIKKTILIVSVIYNLGALFIFKYYDFCVLQINSLTHSDFQLFRLPLPIGISFFTFQALSYVIDVYRGGKAQKNLLYVGLYVSFLIILLSLSIFHSNLLGHSLSPFFQGTPV